MTVKELIKKLKTVNPTLSVMCSDIDEPSRVFEITVVKVKIAGRDEYPEDYNMPEGYPFLVLRS